MSSDERLDTLERQQALLTDGLSRMLQGQWTGMPSLEADLEALDPTMLLEAQPPVLVSEAGPPPPPDWLAYFREHRDTYMAPQAYNWTCSICSLTWLLQATGLDARAEREQVAQQIGYPACVNETYGLIDTQCLVRVLAGYDVDVRQAWVTYDQTWTIAESTAAILNGLGWYHFVGLRGVTGSVLWIANSAGGYAGVYDTLSRDQFNRLGPFQVVYLVP
ncbi:MAG: hypothetical protein JO352_20365 [Chloroflexi bacterium]|nr:hypothetical protein [Chloroflexota bacterium]